MTFFDTLGGKEQQQSETETASDEQSIVDDAQAETSEQPAATLAIAKKKSGAPKVADNTNEHDTNAEGQLTIDVYQDGDDVVIQSTIAGVDANDLDVSITEDSISIRGSRSQEGSSNDEDYYYRELYWGSFSRSVILPVEIDADSAQAALKDGILTIRVPKASRVKERKIDVKKE